MQVLQSKEVLEREFYDSVYSISHSYKTVQTYKTAINHLRVFLEDRYRFDEIVLRTKILAGEIDPYQFLGYLVIYLDKNGIKAKGVRTYLSGINGYLRHLGIRINSDDFKQRVRLPKIIKTREIPLDKDIIGRVLHSVPPKLQTAILVASSSGLRIGELTQLKISDFDFDSNPTKIHVRGNTTKGKQARETFISQEATVSLKDYLSSNFKWNEYNTEPTVDVYIFGKTTNKGKKPKNSDYNPQAAKLALQSSLLYYLKKNPALLIKNENGYHAIHFHGFRKFFRTMTGNTSGRDFAEALMGHGFYMDTYYQLPEEKKRELYLKAEPQLLISNTKSMENNYTELEEKYDKLEGQVTGLLKYLIINSINVPEELLNDSLRGK